MGKKRSRDLTRPPDRGRPCICDVFDLTVACEANVLVVSLVTDLPAGTRVAVTAHRLVSESDGRQWHWTCIEDAVPVMSLESGQNGFVLRMTNTELDTKGFHRYGHLKRTMNVVAASAPSPTLEVSVTAPTTSHRFGLCNRRLTGKAVTVRPSGHSLQRSASIAVPICETVIARLGL